MPDSWTSKTPFGGETSTLRGADSDNSVEYIFNIGTQEPQTAKPTFQARIMETPVHIMADSGSTVNILTKRDFDCMKPKPHLTDKNAKVYPYMSAKPQVLCGKFRTNIVSDHCSSEETF